MTNLIIWFQIPKGFLVNMSGCVAETPDEFEKSSMFLLLKTLNSLKWSTETINLTLHSTSAVSSPPPLSLCSSSLYSFQSMIHNTETKTRGRHRAPETPERGQKEEIRNPNPLSCRHAAPSCTEETGRRRFFGACSDKLHRFLIQHSILRPTIP